MSLVELRARGGDDAARRMVKLLGGYRRVVREGLEEAADYGVEQAQEAAPYQEGTLRDSVQKMVISDVQVKYGTTNPVGLYLDRPVTRRPHYRSTARRGQPTAGWFANTRAAVERYVAGTVAPRIARAIRELWG